MLNEVIETLKAYTDGKDNAGKVEISVMQLNRIIKALECDKCGDCISRKAVDKIINKWLSYPDYELKDEIYDMTKKIHKLPSVTPQPKMGKWRAVKHYGRDYYQCTYCNMERINDHSRGWNYCPFCGANMSEIPTGSEGSEEREDT